MLEKLAWVLIWMSWIKLLASLSSISHAGRRKRICIEQALNLFLNIIPRTRERGVGESGAKYICYVLERLC